MRAILIDPARKTIEETKYDGTLEDIYKHIEQAVITTVRVDEENILYVDDEGLYRPNQHYFRWGPQKYLAGRGIIIGVNEAGEDVEATISIDEVRKDVQFYKIQPVFKDVKTEIIKEGNFTRVLSTTSFDPPGELASAGD